MSVAGARHATMYPVKHENRPSPSTNPCFEPLSVEECDCTGARAVETGVLSTLPRPRVNMRTPYRDMESMESSSVSWLAMD